jgi:predicted phosphoribosyltransferase
MFANRREAGERLATAMREAAAEPDLVLAVPRGGLPVGRAVADAFGVRLDIVAAKKLGAPGNPELAVGAAAADGSVWLNDRLVSELGITGEYVETERRSAMATAQEKEARYRRGREPPELGGNRVAIVDDGVATGATIRACIEAVRNAGPAAVIVAVPVGPTDTLRDLEAQADQLVVVERPQFFRAVGGHYEDFGQVSDEKAMRYLK